MKNIFCLLIGINIFLVEHIVAQCDCGSPYTVTSNVDQVSRSCTLRNAIDCRNADPDKDFVIKFDLAANQKVIKLNTKLKIAHGKGKLIIDGGSNGVIIDGSNLTLTDAAIDIMSSDVVITGLEFREFDGGNDSASEVIQIVKANSTHTISNVNIVNNYFYSIKGETNAITIGEIEGILIQGNYFGVNRNQTKMPIGRMGIRITNGATDAKFNILSNSIYACEYGIGVLTSATNSFNLKIQGNTIGGPNGLGNTVAGIYINGAGTNFTISENRQITYNKVGIEISKCNYSSVNEISYNTIAYSTENGINLLNDSKLIKVFDNTISGNALFGINLDEATVFDVYMKSNKFSCNKSGGIKLANGANRSIPPPTIKTAYTNKIVGTGNSGNIIDVYAHNDNNTCVPDVCQGYRLIGSVSVPSNGEWSLSNLSSGLSEGDQIIATQTFEKDVYANTSAFSICEDVIDPCKNYKVSLTTLDDKLCAGQILQLSATTSGGLSANTEGTWFNPNNSSKPVSNLSTVTTTYPNALPGLYRITMKNNDGCSASANIQISVSANLKATMSPATLTVCAGSPADLSVVPTGGVANYKYLWSDNNKTTQAITTAQLQNATTFRVTVTDSYNCTAIGTVSVGIASPPTVNAGADITICASSEPITLTGSSVTGSVSSGTWSIVSGGGTLSNTSTTSITYTPAANVSGTVRLQLTSIKPPAPCNSVSDTRDIIIKPLPNPTISITESPGSSANDGIICTGQTATLTATGGSTYLWSTNATTASIPVTNAGTYTVKATLNGCSNTKDAVIKVNPPPSVDISGPNAICTGQPVTLTASGNGSFKWSNNKTGSSITETPTQSTKYSVTLTDGNGCTKADTFSVAVESPQTANAGAGQRVCGSTPVTLSGTITGASTGLWTTSGSGTFLNATALSTRYTPSNSDIAAGKVILTLSSNLGGACPNVKDTLTINLTAPIRVNAGPTIQICQSPSPNPVVLSGATVSRGTGVWSIVSGTGTLSHTLQTQRPDTVRYKPAPNFSGPITLRLKASDPEKLCPADSATRALNITALPNPGITVTENSGKQPNDGILCLGGNVTLTATGGTTYRWSLNNATTTSITVSSSGTYTLTATNSNGCSNTTERTITVNPPPQVSISGNNSICRGQPTTLTASGNGTYKWSNNANLNSNTNLVSPTQTTIYAVTLTDGNGCTNSNSFSVAVNNPAEVDAGNDQTVCASAQVVLSGKLSGAATSGTWTSLGTGSFNNPQSTNTTYTPSVADITAGKVTLTLTSNVPNGACPAGMDNITVVLQKLPSFTLQTKQPSDCIAPNGVIILQSLTPGLQYTINYTDDGTATQLPGQTADMNGAIQITGLDFGQYSQITATDQLGCISPASAVRLAPDTLAAKETGKLCAGTRGTFFPLNVSSTPNLSVQWKDLKTGSANGYKIGLEGNNLTVDATNANAGLLQLEYTVNDRGCIAKRVLDVTIQPRPVPVIEITEQSGLAPNDGIICKNDSVTLKVRGQFMSYQWLEPKVSQPMITVAQEGIYLVTVTDSKGCQGSITQKIVVKEAPSIEGKNLVDALCNGSPQASITINAKGGLEPYTYRWSNGDTNLRLNAVKAGTYGLTLTDANRCSSNANFTLNEPPPLNLRLIDTNAVSGPRVKDGTATLEISGGTAAYSLSWTGPIAGNRAILSPDHITLTNLIAGEYQLQLVDRFLCTTQTSFKIGGFSCTPTSPGSLQNALQTICPTDTYTAKFVANPAPLQPLEQLEYILHDQAGETLGKVFNRSSTPDISFKAPLETGKTYYLSAVIGRPGADGLLDLSYPCLAVAKGTPVRFVAKPVSRLSPIVGKDTLCPGENLILETSGLAEAQGYKWILPNQQTLRTSMPKLEIKKIQSQNAGNYRVIAEREGCTLDETPQFALFVHGLKLGEEIYAGEDVAICNNQFSLKASPISSAKGEWFGFSKAVIAEKFKASTLVSDLQLGNNEFVWVVSSEKCKEIGRDTVVVAFGTKVQAFNDSLALEIETNKLIDLKVLENDSFNLSFKTELQALDPPGFGSIGFPKFDPKIPQFTFQDPDGRRGNFDFRYSICQLDNPCPSNCDTATAKLSIIHLPALMEVFTPNGNMKNETLQFLALGDGNEDLTMKIIILNRWGDVVFKSDNYIQEGRNEGRWWDGTHRNQPVPTGTYYAKIIYFSPDGNPVGGPIRKAITLLK